MHRGGQTPFPLPDSRRLFVSTTVIPPTSPGPDDARLAAPAAEALDRWFVEEVLPLEPALMRMLRRHWRRADDIADLRQEVYTRVYESAGRGIILRRLVDGVARLAATRQGNGRRDDGQGCDPR